MISRALVTRATGALLDGVAQIPSRCTAAAWRRAPRLAPRPTLDEAIDRGCRYLRRRRRRDGSFRGFLLPPGASNEWLSAHLALVLEEVTPVADVVDDAAAFLAGRGLARGGWGYNARVGVDLDSTAQALLVLHSTARPVPASIVERMVAAQHPGGGFPTFAPPRAGPENGWQEPHPEVTAIVAWSLVRLGTARAAVAAARRWLGTWGADGAPRSYWWSGPDYGLWALARSGAPLPGRTRAPARRLADLSGAPWLPMAMAPVLYGDAVLRPDARAALEGATERLRTSQLPDGSWPCAPCLRLTDPSCRTAGEAEGPLYADATRAFSTAHALAALWRARERLGAPSSHRTATARPGIRRRRALTSTRRV